jgi:formate/nitrite transporter FocA (FNT family)
MFPIGLVMIVLTGADLFTSNIMFMTTAFLHRRVSIKEVLISWVVSYAGNLGGMLFFMAVIIGYGGVFTDIPAYKTETVNPQSRKPCNLGGIRFCCVLLERIGRFAWLFS